MLQPSTIDGYSSTNADKLGNSPINVSKDENLTRLDSFPMDKQGPPNQHHYQLTRGLIGLDNEKYTMMSSCLDRKYARGDTWRMYTP